MSVLLLGSENIFIFINRNIFGISHDGINFLEMDLESCSLSKTITCELSTVIRDVYHKSRLLALFRQVESNINKLCKYQLEARERDLGLEPISQGRVLVSNAATV